MRTNVETALFSVRRDVRSFTATKALLKEHGVGPVKPAHTVFHSYYGFTIPRQYVRKAVRLLSGQVIVETVH